MTHDPSYHLLDDNWPNQDSGLVPPLRNLGGTADAPVNVQRNETNVLVCSAVRLRIANLDRADPPGYRPGTIPRGDGNDNFFEMWPDTRMPEIRVQCEVGTLDTAQHPIYWRLQCRHVICRHVKRADDGNYQYNGGTEIPAREWQGRSFESDFALFANQTGSRVVYDYGSNDPRTGVAGGNAILSVTARDPLTGVVLLDYVHLRIVGQNPSAPDVLNYIDFALSGRESNIVRMMRAIAAHETHFTQFSSGQQTASTMIFKQSHHHRDPTQPDCPVRFVNPRDPPGFPLVTFDYGVGIAQYTKLPGRTISVDEAWDWRENVRAGINVLMSCARRTYRAGMTWDAWAREAWSAYNGGHPDYANLVAANGEGRQVSHDPVPVGFDLNAQTAAVRSLPADPPAPAWPPSSLA